MTGNVSIPRLCSGIHGEIGTVLKRKDSWNLSTRAWPGVRMTVTLSIRTCSGILWFKLTFQKVDSWNKFRMTIIFHSRLAPESVNWNCFERKDSESVTPGLTRGQNDGQFSISDLLRNTVSSNWLSNVDSEINSEWQLIFQFRTCSGICEWNDDL